MVTKLHLRVYRSVLTLVEQIFVCKKFIWFVQLHKGLDPEIRLLASMCSAFMAVSVEDVGGAASVAIWSVVVDSVTHKERFPGFCDVTIAECALQVIDHIPTVAVYVWFDDPCFAIRCCEWCAVFNVSESTYFALVDVAFGEDSGCGLCNVVGGFGW